MISGRHFGLPDIIIESPQVLTDTWGDSNISESPQVLTDTWGDSLPFRLSLTSLSFPPPLHALPPCGQGLAGGAPPLEMTHSPFTIGSSTYELHNMIRHI